MTQDIYARLRDTVLTALRGMVPDLPDGIAARVEVTPARDPAHGDMATNAALVAAKAARQPPAKLAAGLVGRRSCQSSARHRRDTRRASPVRDSSTCAWSRAHFARCCRISSRPAKPTATAAPATIST